MVCPNCGGTRLQAIHTVNSGPIVKRVRRCRDCFVNTNTIEIPVFKNILSKEDIEEYEKYIHEELAQSEK